MSKESLPDIDPIETREWLDALDSVMSVEGQERASYLIKQLIDRANSLGANIHSSINTAYRNTISPMDEKAIPPDEGVRKRISALIRWNALAMVLRAGKIAPELGGTSHLMHPLPPYMKLVLTIFLKRMI